MGSRQNSVSAVLAGLALAASLSAQSFGWRSVDPPAPPATRTRHTVGILESVNKQSKTIVVRNAAGKRDTMVYSEKTDFHFAGSPEMPATRASMVTGGVVTVIYVYNKKVAFAQNILETLPAKKADSASPLKEGSKGGRP
jgi:hypothetical protein